MLGSSRLVGSVAVMVTALALLCAGCGGSSQVDALRGRMLSANELPGGWSQLPAAAAKTKVNRGSCVTGPGSRPPGLAYVSETFVQGTAIPSFGEVLATGRALRATWARSAATLARCHTVSLTLDGKTVTSSVRPLAFAHLGSSTEAFTLSITSSGIRIGSDVVLFTAGRYGGYLEYSDLGSPRLATVEAFARTAVEKALGHAGAGLSDGMSIASAPVRTVHTALGRVGYRVTGRGQPLVLIMGYGGTMEEWDRRLVDALAQRYRVYIFDNAGIGETQRLPKPLTIDAMAQQTSALIAKLGLGRVNVLGWSMGSMIAQALAVLHPSQVRRLVLCASYPGNGTTVQPSQEAVNALKSGNEQKAMADLFPANQAAAGTAFTLALSAYPTSPPAPAAVVDQQSDAIKAWWTGTDRTGRLTGGIRAPTLVADGTLDRLDPTINSRRLAALIHGAQLELYPDAGHAFLFQDQAALVPRVEAFLG